LVTVPVPFGKITHAASAHSGAGLVEIDAHLSRTYIGAARVNIPAAPLTAAHCSQLFDL